MTTTAAPRRFVAFADVIGFKHLTQALPHEDLARRCELLLTLAQTAASGARWHPPSHDGDHARPAVETAVVNMMQATDSVFLWTDTDAASEFTALIQAVGVLVAGGFGMHLPIRAGVAMGELTAGEEHATNPRIRWQKLYGRGLVEAVATEAKYQWAGAAVTDEAVAAYQADLARSAPQASIVAAEGANGPLVRYPAGMSGFGQDVYAVNWRYLAARSFTPEAVRRAFTLYPGHELPASASAKRDGAERFCTYLCALT